MIKKLVKPVSSADVFPELALTLYLFIKLLYCKLASEGVRDVYFMSREGQPLMQLFDLFQQKFADSSGTPIKAHYLEVSRRSTFLPSLGDLRQENFENLFRQYRTMSIAEFLASLGLESHSLRAIQELGISETDYNRRFDDLPSECVFKNLLSSPWFHCLYESERLARRNACVEYLGSLTGGVLPKTLHIVDVGWKGTIQDNLYRLLCSQMAPTIDKICGYYVGLIGQGGACANNAKAGLLFSNVNEKSLGFDIFNENRALFEVILAADHGSVATYEYNADGVPFPARSAFEEEGMVKQYVVPVQKSIFTRFRQIIAADKNGVKIDPAFIDEVAGRHARMVFDPTESEMNWFSSIFHVENFGVFEKSKFGAASEMRSLRERFVFSLRLIFNWRSIDFGFWPWLTIRQRGFSGFALAYRFFRS